MSVKEKLLASAQKNLQKGQIAKAVKDYQKIVETDPKDVRNRQKLAELLSRAQAPEEALEQYEAVARHYAETGFYLKAIAVYKQMQKLDPTRPEFYNRLGELNERQGLTGNALAEYRNLAGHYEKNRMYSEEAKILQKMRELEPDNLNLRVKIVEINLQGGNEEQARRELQEILDGLAGDDGRALKIHELFLTKFPQDPVLKIGLGEALVHKGEVARGIALLKEALPQDPENDRILQALAEGYRRQGDPRNEWLICQQLLVKHPEDLGWRETRLRAGLEAREFGRVLDELEKWQGSFLEAGRNELLKELYGQLKTALPQEKRVLRAMDSIGKIGEVRGGAPEPDEPRPAPFADRDCTPTDDPAADPEEELLEIAELTEVVEEAEAELSAEVSVTGEPEEIPLEFLEEIEMSPVAAGPMAEPESAQETEAEIAPESETEIELELELELELESPDDVYLLEAEEPAAEPTGEIDEPMELVDLEVETEEGFIELTLDEASPGGTGGAATESFQENHFELGAELIDLDSLAPDETLQVAEFPSASAPAKRIKTDVEVEDPESHYNLGIAYKEMGLLDDAVGEFDKAMRDPTRAVPCLILKGICLLEKGDREKAESAFKTGLDQPHLAESERVSLHYEMGELYESWGRLPESLECFQYVADRDLFYRQAGERVASLRQRLGLEEGGGGTGTKNRVSYV